MKKLKWNQKILFALFSGILYTLIFCIFSWDFNEVYTKKFLSLVLVFTIFFGFGFPFLMEKLSLRLLSKIKTPDLNENETIIKEDGANLFQNFFNAIGGKLFLTEKRLIFNSHKLNLPNSYITIQLENISDILERKTIGIINNGLRIKTKNGLTYDFVVNDRKSWIEKLKK